MNNRIRRGIFIVGFLALFFKVSISYATPLVGDIDGNGQLDLADAIKVLQIASGIDVTVPIDVSFGDINQDNVIGIAEAIEAKLG